MCPRELCAEIMKASKHHQGAAVFLRAQKKKAFCTCIKSSDPSLHMQQLLQWRTRSPLKWLDLYPILQTLVVRVQMTKKAKSGLKGQGKCGRREPLLLNKCHTLIYTILPWPKFSKLMTQHAWALELGRRPLSCLRDRGWVIIFC